MKLVRGRTPLCAFKTIQIRVDDEALCEGEVLRLWYKKIDLTAPIVSMTFIMTGIGDGRQALELEFGKFESDLQNSSKRSCKVQLRITSTARHVSISFTTIEGV
jgi:hypothetical protein